MQDVNILQEKFPFLTIFNYAGEEKIGIIQNQSKTVVSAYVLNDMKDVKLVKKFIDLGDIWWNESNRKVPINLFLKDDFTMFNKYLKNYIAKEFKIVAGPTVSLSNLATKRVKRKKIELIRSDEF